MPLNGTALLVALAASFVYSGFLGIRHEVKAIHHHFVEKHKATKQ